MKKSELGRRGEDIALEYLLSLGLELRERNFRSGHKEIDIIMESDEYIHIVEVRSSSIADPRESIGLKKQRYLISAARAYIGLKRVCKEVSFDVVTVLFDGLKTEIEYVPLAFYPFFV